MKSNILAYITCSKILITIFFLGLFLRFLYFPGNIYFGFDQARDAFTTLQLIQGHLKIVGPPTGVEGLFHGPLYYYFYAPLYFFSHGDPTWVAVGLRLINALAIFLVFWVGQVMFNRRVGLIATLIFSVSFEQTQYALYFNHPSLAVVSVILFYLGLGLLFFKKQAKGLILTLLGLGLSLQFEFVLIYLAAILILLMISLRKSLPKINGQILFWSLAALGISTSSFVITEIKFNFRTITHLSSVFTSTSGGTIRGYFENIFLIGQRLINDNLISFTDIILPVFILLIIASVILSLNKDLRPKIFFIAVWIFGGILPYLNNQSATPLYYYSVGASVGLLILVSFFIDKIVQRFGYKMLFLLVIVFISNIILIKDNNPKGVIPTINVQSGMLLENEKKALDFIYQQSGNDVFAVKALTMPLSVNTTWSYLFEWYGQNEYGRLPLWIGPNALGFPGNLKVIDARSSLPLKQFLIIEPTRGIRQGLVDSFMKEEAYFTTVVMEKKFGDIIVQERLPI